jgi:hypothetical protein
VAAMGTSTFDAVDGVSSRREPGGSTVLVACAGAEGKIGQLNCGSADGGPWRSEA